MTEMSEHAALSDGMSSSVDQAAKDRAAARVLVRSAYPRVVGRALAQAARVQVAAWDRSLRNLRRVQEKTLAALLNHAKRTEFGRSHGFAQIRGYEDFTSRVGIGDYDSFSPYIERMRRGERDLLVPEFVRYFGNSSGSSNHGRSKFLPITERQIRPPAARRQRRAHALLATGRATTGCSAALRSGSFRRRRCAARARPSSRRTRR